MLELSNKKNNDKYKYFVVIALGWMGDTIMADGLCKNIKEYNSDAVIIFISLKAFADIPKLIPEVSEIIVYDKQGLHKGPLGAFKLAKKFKNRKVEVAIIVHPHERGVVCAKAIGAKNIVSTPLKGKLNFINLLINKKRKNDIEEIKSKYKNFYNADNLNVLDIATKQFYPKLKISEEDIIDIDRYNLPDNYVVLVPESKNDFRSWDYENIALFIKNCKEPVVLTGTNKTQPLAERLEKDGCEFINLCGKTSIMELANIIKKSKLTISVDTGSMHLSYSLGTKTICIFYVPEKVKKWLPQELPQVHLLLGERVIEEGKMITKKPVNYYDVLSMIEKIS